MLDDKEKGFTRRERDRVLEAGWTKVKEYVSIINRTEGSRNYFERWTEFATTPGVTVEKIKQAVFEGGPTLRKVEDPIETFVLRIPVSLKLHFVKALKVRGRRDYKKGEHGRPPEKPREEPYLPYDGGDAIAVYRLLRHAKRGLKLEQEEQHEAEVD
jgi:hypothetical protein